MRKYALKCHEERNYQRIIHKLRTSESVTIVRYVQGLRTLSGCQLNDERFVDEIMGG